MFVPLPNQKFEDFSKTTLIMSAISSGSAGTVAIDLIAFNNKNITKIGYYQSKYLEHVVAVMDFEAKGNISLPAEVYQTSGFTFLQFRTPKRINRNKDFNQELYGFLKASQFTNIIMLSSAAKITRPDIEINKLNASVYATWNQKFEDFNKVSKLVDMSQFLNATSLLDTKQEEKVTDIMQGSGLAIPFLKQKEFFQSFNILIIFAYASPGFDLQAAIQLTKAITAAVNQPNVLSFCKIDQTQSISNCNYKFLQCWNKLF